MSCILSTGETGRFPRQIWSIPDRLKARHIYGEKLEYIMLELMQLDSKGASSGWSESLNVSIAENDPPNMPIIPSGPTSGRSRAAYKYATSAKDPDGDLVKYVFDWGDRTTSWTGLTFIDSGTNESVSHKWSKSGAYQVKAMALDDKGAASGWSNSLVVNIL